MRLITIKKITFFIFTLVASMLINSCATLNSCDCPGLEGKIYFDENSIDA